ncbi:MAG: hypothetical protein Q4E36_01830 [Bacillota bacterium]|nr:hypothetical protein [Bacillota bacterium]
MTDKKDLVLALEDLREDNIKKQQRGLHIILASVLIWLGVFLVHLSTLPIITKNLLTFCLGAFLLPLSFLFSKFLKIDFQNKTNPLSKLGLIFSLNQMLYILIVMWVYGALPEKMLMVYALVFAAHLLPYGWLYRSKTYYVMSILIALAVLVLGVLRPSSFVAAFMLGAEIVFSILLAFENKKFSSQDL